MTLKTKFAAALGFVILCSLAVNRKAPSQVKDDADEQRNHEAWLRDRLAEAESIKVGMTRANLLTVFGVDGGVSSVVRERYV